MQRFVFDELKKVSAAITVLEYIVLAIQKRGVQKSRYLVCFHKRWRSHPSANANPPSSGFFISRRIMASRKITDLSIPMQALACAFKDRCVDEGLDIVIICTYRDNIEQEAAHSCGASNCRGGQSAHNQLDMLKRPAAEAFDVGVIRAGKYIGDGNDPDYLRAGEIGESLGLKWAGRWIGRLKETAHFERADWKQ